MARFDRFTLIAGPCVIESRELAMAVANAINAVHAGATMVQGTINGYGERCGNADLTAVIPVLSVKMNRTCVPLENLEQLKPYQIAAGAVGA